MIMRVLNRIIQDIQWVNAVEYKISPTLPRLLYSSVQVYERAGHCYEKLGIADHARDSYGHALDCLSRSGLSAEKQKQWTVKIKTRIAGLGTRAEEDWRIEEPPLLMKDDGEENLEVLKFEN